MSQQQQNRSSDSKGSGRRGGGKSGGKRSGRGRRFHKGKTGKNTSIVLPCALCDKPIKYMPTAIGVENDKPAHFDCVLKMLNESEETRDNEKICYLGNGVFGIIQYQGKQGGGNFNVKKRIQVEDPECEYAWKKKVCNPRINETDFAT